MLDVRSDAAILFLSISFSFSPLIESLLIDTFLSCCIRTANPVPARLIRADHTALRDFYYHHLKKNGWLLRLYYHLPAINKNDVDSLRIKPNKNKKTKKKGGGKMN